MTTLAPSRLFPQPNTAGPTELSLWLDRRDRLWTPDDLMRCVRSAYAEPLTEDALDRAENAGPRAPLLRAVAVALLVACCAIGVGIAIGTAIGGAR